MAEPEKNGANQQDNPAQPEKTFTQAEVDTLIGRRLAKAMRGMPSEDELSAFRTWKDGQAAAAENTKQLQAELENSKKALADAEQYKKENILLRQGISAEDVDYYVFKISKLVTDKKTFEQAAEEYLKESTAGRSKVRVDMAAQLGGRGKTQNENEQMNALIRGARK